MRTVTVNGKVYSLPFERLLPPLTAARYAELRADVAAHGVLQNLVTARTPLWGRILVEGMHRALIAEGLDLDVPYTDLGLLTEDDARDRCKALNLFRRHMTAEEQAAARGERIVRVTAARSEGLSLRTIAAQEQVSVTQVVKDLQAADPARTPVYAEVQPAAPLTRSAPRAARVRQPPAVRAQRAGASLRDAVRRLTRSPRRAALEALAAQHGVPFAGNTWPALEQILAVLRDAAGGAASA